MVPGPSTMDRLLLSRRPVPAHAAAADGEFLEVDVLWPTAPAVSSSPRGLRLLLAALPEDEGGQKKNKKRAGAARSVAAAAGMARSAPVRIPSAAGARRGMPAPPGGGGEDEAVVPPHEVLARRAAAARSSVLEGAGRTLKGRDLRRLRNAVLRRTGFLD